LMGAGLVGKGMKDKLKKIKLLALDFDGTMTVGAFVIFREDGMESVICSRRDSYGILNILPKAGVDIVVISKETNKVVASRCKKIGIKCWHGVDTASDKLEILQSYAQENGFSSEEICYGGDDINDIACLEWVGFSFTVADGHKRCKEMVDYITEAKGGEGAVREVCDLILEAKEK
jgi:YrbI family 3-deoxy-D-manno-octulosonate 8-phosphate phosphatase